MHCCPGFAHFCSPPPSDQTHCPKDELIQHIWEPLQEIAHKPTVVDSPSRSKTVVDRKCRFHVPKKEEFHCALGDGSFLFVCLCLFFCFFALLTLISFSLIVRAISQRMCEAFRAFCAEQPGTKRDAWWERRRAFLGLPQRKVAKVRPSPVAVVRQGSVGDVGQDLDTDLEPKRLF
jgi:hypothetical protein